ncbi:hypothetical protein [Lentibacillus sp. CBA3610]|nr:hypothetical protein [Lentibacillus sp. CBA3610]
MNKIQKKKKKQAGDSRKVGWFSDSKSLLKRSPKKKSRVVRKRMW